MSRKFDIHPAATIFPLIEGHAFAELKADIEKHGQREPVVFYKGQLLDGRNRARACDELGLQILECELDQNEEPVAYVLSANLHRRHLTESQRGLVAARIAELFKPAAKERQTATLKKGTATPVTQNLGERTNGKHSGESSEQAATALNVSRGTVENARVVLTQGSKDLIAAVERGDVAVSRAAKIAKAHDKKSQMAALDDKPPKAERDVLGRLKKLLSEMTIAEVRQAALIVSDWLEDRESH